MNTIVRYVRAGLLPDELRGGIDPARTVRVTVADDARKGDAERSSDPSGIDAARAMFERLQQRLRDHPELAEPDPVGRVRRARDGED